MFQKNVRFVLAGCALIAGSQVVLPQIVPGVVPSVANPFQFPTGIPSVRKKASRGAMFSGTHGKRGARVSRAEQAGATTITNFVCFQPGVGWTKKPVKDRDNSLSFAVGREEPGCGSAETAKSFGAARLGSVRLKDTEAFSGPRLPSVLATESFPDITELQPSLLDLSRMQLLQESVPQPIPVESREILSGAAPDGLLVPEQGEELFASKLNRALNVNSFTMRQMVIKSGDLESRLALDRQSSYSRPKEKHQRRRVQSSASRTARQSGKDNNTKPFAGSRLDNQ
jgi:hypothetical protein